jgi:pyruvate kinase
VAVRRAKIICTIGPASDSPEQLVELIEAGMDVARLNFSHGTHEEHAARAARIREAAKACGKYVAVLQDLCGPKIRCGRFAGGTKPVALGDRLKLIDASEEPETVYDGDVVPIQFDGVAGLRERDDLLLDDGRVHVQVVSAGEEGVEVEVRQGGTLRDKVGVHVPASRVHVETLTDKDKADLAYGLSLKVDYVALSFVRTAADVQLVRDICEAWGRPTPVVAKIETPAAIDHLEPIVLASDAVMVARGDLGVEFSPERVPVFQRRVLGLGRRHNRPVIIATEMMQSMVNAPRPTRAEASDVATAVFDGADAVMLSGETATGAHPSLVVRTMARIIVEAEQSAFHAPEGTPRAKNGRRVKVAESLARNACEIARDTGARLIVVFTESGRTATYAAGARPPVPIVALSPRPVTLRRLCMVWGVVPWHLLPADDHQEMIDHAHDALLSNGIVSPGDSFVAIYGARVGVSGSTNAIQVKVVG